MKVEPVPSGPPAPPPSRFFRRVYHSSAIVGDHVVIVGGGVSQIQNASNPSILAYPNDAIVRLPLGTSWDAPTLIPDIQSTNWLPKTHNPILWVDEDETLYIKPGLPSFLLSQEDQLSWYPDGYSVAAIHFKDNGRYTWSSFTPESSIAFATGGLGVSGDNRGYYLGGARYDPSGDTGEDVHIWDLTWQENMAIYNLSWSLDQPDYHAPPTQYAELPATVPLAEHDDSPGVPAYGAAQFVPTFGPAGVMAVLSGHVYPEEENFTAENSDLPDFSNITLYDPSRDAWHWQKATGDVPDGINFFCSTGAESASGTYDIYVYGGCRPDGYELTSHDVYVLSLPSFRWTNITPQRGSTARCHHTCHVVGNQLLSIGGQLSQAGDLLQKFGVRDGNSQGLSLLDLNELRWGDNYDANRKIYEAPTAARNWYKEKSSQDVSWTDDETAALFPKGDWNHFGRAVVAIDNGGTTTSDTVVGTNPNAQPTLTQSLFPTSSVKSGSNDSTSSSSGSLGTGAIAGIAIGGVLGFAFILLSTWFLLGQRRKRKEAAAADAAAWDKPELPGSNSSDLEHGSGSGLFVKKPELYEMNESRPEIGGKAGESHELETREPPVELAGGTLEIEVAAAKSGRTSAMDDKEDTFEDAREEQRTEERSMPRWEEVSTPRPLALPDTDETKAE